MIPPVNANLDNQHRSSVSSHNENYNSHQPFHQSIRLSSSPTAGGQINALLKAENHKSSAIRSEYYNNSSSSSKNFLTKNNENEYKPSQFQLVDLSTSPPSDTYNFEFNKNSPTIPTSRQNIFRQQHSQQYLTSNVTSPSTPSSNFYSATNSFDENFSSISQNQASTLHESPTPYVSSSTSNRSNGTVINFPLSETEPLLTNIEATVNDPDRAISLNKNSASLIFTKKDFAAATTTGTYNSSNNYCYKSSPSRERSNSNVDRAKDYRDKITAPETNQSRSRHHSLKAAIDLRKQQQQQQHWQNQSQHPELNQSNHHHRRSLPLSYIHSVNRYNTGHNHWNSGVSQSSFTQAAGFVVGTNQNLASNTTAATARKQHAYSWYAPVYSALEEELEQDSRDSSPIHNLANAKKNSITKNHYHHQVLPSLDNEKALLLESKNQINIQPSLLRQSRNISQQPPSTLHLINSHNSSFVSGSGGVSGSGTTLLNNSTVSKQQYDAEGPHAGSLLAGGPVPRRRRIENFFKSLVGRKTPSTTSTSTKDVQDGRNNNNNNNAATNAPLLPSPEIKITRTPSEQNVLGRDINGGGEIYRRSSSNFSTSEKIALTPPAGSTTSLNIVQQKLWNVVPLLRRERSASSLHNEKSQSIVQYTSLRKCETVLALTRQSSSICSPVLGIGPGIIGGGGDSSGGSGIFSASGVEQIRPLNRLRNSLSTSNATCSRCSSLLSLGVSGSRYSLNIANSGLININNNNHNNNYNINNNDNGNGCQTAHPNNHNHHNSHYHQQQLQQPQQQQQQNNYHHTNNNSIVSSSNSVKSDLQNGNSQLDNTTASANRSRKSSAGANSNQSNSISSENSPPSNITTATINSSTLSSTPTTPTAAVTDAASTEITSNFPATMTSLLSISPSSLSVSSASQQNFEIFTCKLCLLDVSTAEATTISLCGCRFCTECMRAYVEFEICEAAYEISCPDAQCPAQGVIALHEIANLTSANLMKKHHRYRLNREIELDKSRIWCPRAGCETVCHVGVRPGTSQEAAAVAASTSLASNLGLSPVSLIDKNDYGASQVICAVQCPSCKDEFCSACKKVWHPTMTCEENSRRLVADGQDDIGIPFDNDLIKCCPMCAVPIEKDEGCAQMMCKRCKHVFCWYCLASLDDDFLLRHYDKGPCKNKLGHSRASVVWHRAQVIGIFAGFGILLLVASPLLLLAAPCIICCKCRICSGGTKMEDPEADIEEAAALHS